MSQRGTNTEGQAKNSNAAVIPPHNLQAEEALLGAALLSSSALEVLATKVKPNDFYKPAHQIVAEACLNAFERGLPADIVTIADAISRTGRMDEIGGPSALLTLQANTPSTSNAERYAEIIHNDATLRRVMIGSAAASALAQSRPADAHDAVEKLQAIVESVASQNGKRSYSSLDVPDMLAVTNGEFVQEQPELLRRNDGQALFYMGKMHVLQAEPGSGKSWIALAASKEVLAAGGSVVYLDYEDSVRGIAGRLLALGVDPVDISSRFQYVRPNGPIGVSERAELAMIMRNLNPDIVIIDGVAEAISRDGYDEDKNSDVVKWVDQFPRPIAATGCCVVMIDHIAKDEDGKRKSRYARGASHKLAAVDGASYQVKIISSFSRHRGGSVKLIVAKDRPGVFTIKETAAVVRISPSADGQIVRMAIEKSVEMEPEGEWRPTRLMEKISLELERASAPLTPRLVSDLVGVGQKKGSVADALARLQVDNYVTTFKTGTTTYLRLRKPYRQGDRPLSPESVQTSLADEWISQQDELAKRRQEKERQANEPPPPDPTDPGPSEPS